MSEIRKVELDMIAVWNGLLEAAFLRFDRWMMRSAAAERRPARRRARVT